MTRRFIVITDGHEHGHLFRKGQVVDATGVPGLYAGERPGHGYLIRQQLDDSDVTPARPRINKDGAAYCSRFFGAALTAQMMSEAEERARDGAPLVVKSPRHWTVASEDADGTLHTVEHPPRHLYLGFPWVTWEAAQ